MDIIRPKTADQMVRPASPSRNHIDDELFRKHAIYENKVSQSVTAAVGDGGREGEGWWMLDIAFCNTDKEQGVRP